MPLEGGRLWVVSSYPVSDSNKKATKPTVIYDGVVFLERKKKEETEEQWRKEQESCCTPENWYECQG